eukprot:1613591-Rhodomonas_salina.1
MRERGKEERQKGADLKSWGSVRREPRVAEGAHSAVYLPRRTVSARSGAGGAGGTDMGMMVPKVPVARPVQKRAAMRNCTVSACEPSSEPSSATKHDRIRILRRPYASASAPETCAPRKLPNTDDVTTAPCSLGSFSKLNILIMGMSAPVMMPTSKPHSTLVAATVKASGGVRRERHTQAEVPSGTASCSSAIGSRLNGKLPFLANRLERCKFSRFPAPEGSRSRVGEVLSCRA